MTDLGQHRFFFMPVPLQHVPSWTPSAGHFSLQFVALFSVTRHNVHSFFPFLGVFSWNCGRGSRPWTSQIALLGLVMPHCETPAACCPSDCWSVELEDESLCCHSLQLLHILCSVTSLLCFFVNISLIQWPKLHAPGLTQNDPREAHSVLNWALNRAHNSTKRHPREESMNNNRGGKGKREILGSPRFGPPPNLRTSSFQSTIFSWFGAPPFRPETFGPHFFWVCSSLLPTTTTFRAQTRQSRPLGPFLGWQWPEAVLAQTGETGCPKAFWPKSVVANCGTACLSKPKWTLCLPTRLGHEFLCQQPFHVLWIGGHGLHNAHATFCGLSCRRLAELWTG